MKESLKKFADNISNLIDVKTVVTFAVVGFTCWGFSKEMIPSEAFMTISSAVITYYFTKKES